MYGIHCFFSYIRLFGTSEPLGVSPLRQAVDKKEGRESRMRTGSVSWTPWEDMRRASLSSVLKLVLPDHSQLGTQAPYSTSQLPRISKLGRNPGLFSTEPTFRHLLLQLLVQFSCEKDSKSQVKVLRK